MLRLLPISDQAGTDQLIDPHRARRVRTEGRLTEKAVEHLPESERNRVDLSLLQRASGAS